MPEELVLLSLDRFSIINGLNVIRKRHYASYTNLKAGHYIFQGESAEPSEYE